MPTISMFYGIAIMMFVGDHPAPHFHAKYQNYKATFNFDGDMTKGKMPPKQRKLIAAWAEIHRKELEENWERAISKEMPFDIEPLR
ncbi:MAG: DUF4160 domain-containing protein [Actinomycetaceae bacterium]|nr:DUF4160 domain-containing protein [Actinomycetaceae bacterium]